MDPKVEWPVGGKSETPEKISGSKQFSMTGKYSLIIHFSTRPGSIPKCQKLDPQKLSIQDRVNQWMCTDAVQALIPKVLDINIKILTNTLYQIWTVFQFFTADTLFFCCHGLTLATGTVVGRLHPGYHVHRFNCKRKIETKCTHTKNANPLEWLVTPQEMHRHR